MSRDRTSPGYDRQLKIEGDKGRLRAEVLFDSEASVSLIKKSIAKNIATILKLRLPRKFTLGKAGEYLEVNEVTRVEITFDGHTISDEYFVAPDLSQEVILGANTFQKWRIKLDFENDRILVGSDLSRLKLIAIEPHCE